MKRGHLEKQLKNNELHSILERSVRVQFNIDHDQSDRRADNFLFSQFKNVPKSVIYRLIRQGQIKANRKKIKPDYRLKKGDEITVYSLKLPEHFSQQPSLPSKESIEKLTKRILYEDGDLLILDKPVGMAVHGGTQVSWGVIEILRQAGRDQPFLELAHRLDRETSGCLVIAKKRSVLRELHQLFREGKVQKVYYALTCGHWKEKHHQVSAHLVKNSQISGERKVKVDEEGKYSITEFQSVRRFPLADFVKVKLFTGRTHQIRVHASNAGHPLAGDEKYGDKAFNRIMKQLGLRRLFLQAAKINFTLPSRGKIINIEIPLDEELSKFLEKLML